MIVAPEPTVAQPEASPEPVTAILTTQPEPQDTRIDVSRAWSLRIKHGLSYQQIADMLGCSKQGVHQVLRKFSEIIDNPKAVAAYQDARVDLLTVAEERLLRSVVDEEAIQKAGLRDRVIAFGTVYDKRRLEAGQSTQNLGILSQQIQDMDREVFKIRPVDTQKDTTIPDNHSQKLINTAPVAEIVSRESVQVGTSDKINSVNSRKKTKKAKTSTT